MTKGDIAIHKLRGEHEYVEADTFTDPQGDEIQVSKCTVCGHRKEKNLTTESRKFHASTMSAFTSYGTYQPSSTGALFTNYSGAGAGGGNISGGGGGAGGGIFMKAKKIFTGNAT